MFCSLTEDMKALLRKSRTDEYTYEVILKTFQRHRNEIIDSSRKEFVSQYLKLKYILGIVDGKIPDVLSLCQKQHEAQRNNREIAASLELTVEEAEELSKYFGNVSIESINVLVDFNEVGANAKTVLNLLRENGVGSYDQYDDLRRKCDDWYSRTEMKYDYSDYLKAFVAGEDALNRLIEDAKAESQKSKEEWAERCKSKIKPVQSSRYDDLW